jgi:outer membrane protein assembly factor BamB
MPIVKDGAIYISYFIPSGDAIDNAYKSYVETKKGDDPLLYWLTTQAGRISADDVLAAIDPATGKTLWRAVFKDRGHNWQGHKGGPANLTPVAADGKVFFAGSAGVVYAVDAKTGQALWEHTPACAAEIRQIGGVIYAIARQALGSPLMYADGVVVSYEYGGRLWNAGAAIGLDAQTGRKLWALPGLSYLNRCTLNGKTYFLGGSNQTSCIEPKTGKVLWKVPCAGVPVARGDRAFMQESETQYGYYKLSPQGAERLWSATLPKTDLNNSNDLVSLNATHALLASVANNLFRVSLADGKVDSVTAGGHNGPGGWVAGDRYLYHSDCKHGNPGCEWYDVGSAAMKQLWTGLLPHPGTTSYGPQITCLVIDGRIYRRGKDGIYCFDARKR